MISSLAYAQEATQVHDMHIINLQLLHMHTLNHNPEFLNHNKGCGPWGADVRGVLPLLLRVRLRERERERERFIDNQFDD